MERDLEDFIYLYQSDKPWVLSLTEFDRSEGKTRIGEVSFRTTIPPEFARWLVLEMTKRNR